MKFKEIAKRVVIFLEDRRVLYNPYELEMPKYCYSSVIEIRQFLTKQLYDISSNSELGDILKGMRSACRKFLDSIEKPPFKQEIEHARGLNISMGLSIEFYSGIGELRGIIGILISKLLVMYGLDCESDLLKIIPIDLD